MTTGPKHISGGNSSSLPLLLSGRMPAGVNNLRIGEAILQGGRDTFHSEPWRALDRDAFRLTGELLEVKVKPSVPIGTTGVATDHYGEMSVGGKRAVRESLDAAARLPLKVFFILGGPGYYQNHPFGHSGWPTLEDMLEMLDWDECVGMNEAFAARVVDDED